jgi:hypothetical protein
MVLTILGMVTASDLEIRNFAECFKLFRVWRTFNVLRSAVQEEYLYFPCPKALA